MIEINTIYNESCIDTMSRFKDKEIDLIVTSPPYNMRLRIRNGDYIEREQTSSFCKKYEHFSDALPIDDFYNFHKQALSEMLRVSKIVCYNFQLVTGSKEAFLKIMGDFNKQIKDIIIWDKGSGQPAMHECILNSCYEFILILEDDDKCGRMIQNAKFKRGEMNNIIRIGRGKKVDDTHGAIFPEALPKILIESFSNKGYIVYDPFLGSGTTARVAILTDRSYIGSEIVKEYYDLSEKRIKEAQKEKELQIF